MAIDSMEKTLTQLEATAVCIGVLMCRRTPADPPQTGKPGPPMNDLIRVLLGMKAPSEPQLVEDLQLLDTKLNASQKEAIRFCLESPEVACIHGPPGM